MYAYIIQKRLNYLNHYYNLQVCVYDFLEDYTFEYIILNIIWIITRHMYYIIWNIISNYTFTLANFHTESMYKLSFIIFILLTCLKKYFKILKYSLCKMYEAINNFSTVKSSNKK